MADKYTRLDSQFNSVAAFWKPDARDDYIAGSLVVDEEAITFTTAPEYLYGAEANRVAAARFDPWGTDHSFSVLHGIFEEGDCTLLQLRNFNSPGRIELRAESQSLVSMS